MSMSSVIQVNRIYLIFNPVHFLVDSSEITYIVRNDGGSIKYIRPAHFEHNSSDEKNEGVFELDEKFRSTNFGAIFNPNGFIKEYALLWPNLEPKEINEYDYSRNNRLIKHSQFLYFSDATISNIYTFTYPGSSMNPTLIERTHDGHSADKTIIEYNYRKQPVKISTIDYNGETESKNIPLQRLRFNIP